ncbi:hypothetical protein [Candidatus Venteria ishoeyi]|nr:hypothetical protein [Candidatus Venteria ishoeyi]
MIDIETGKQIILKRGGIFQISGDDHQFEEKDELHQDYEPLDSEKKLDFLKEKHENYRLRKIADAEQVFVYRLGLSKKTSEEQANKFLFNAILLDDLYMRSLDGKKWTLCDCYCETTKCLDGELEISESVKANSLNKLYSDVISYYFPRQRSTACNAFNTFYFAINPNHIYDDVKPGRLKSLDDVRKEFIKKEAKENFKRALKQMK